MELKLCTDPLLRKISEPVEKIDAAEVKFMRDLLEAMYTHKGIGLAAPQMGILRRVIVMDVAEEQNPDKAIVMANPEILWRSDETFTYKEGCLSIPSQYAEVTRPKKVRVGYIDINGKKQEGEFEDLASSCVQHEIDHLNGVLFVDYLSSLKRNMMIRKIEKMSRLMAEEEGAKVL